MVHLDRPLLIHVAAESEGRGRVVLASRSAKPHPVALSAAFGVARAFETWVDCLLIECPDVVALSAHGFARAISHAGRLVPLSDRAATLEAQTGATSLARRTVTALALTSGVRVATSVVRDGLGDALARACAVEGPWNIVALAEPVDVAQGNWLPNLLAKISGATGIVCVGPRALQARAGGAIVVVVEDLDRLPQMLRAAERLASARENCPSKPIALLVAGGTAQRTEELDGHLRLLLAGVPQSNLSSTDIVDAGLVHGTSIEIVEALRRLQGSFVIASANGIAFESNSDAAVFLSTMTSPLLLVR